MATRVPALHCGIDADGFGGGVTGRMRMGMGMGTITPFQALTACRPTRRATRLD